MIFAGTRLTTLDLSDNAIGPQAIHGIKDFLTSEACFGLKNLYLNNCGLGSAGVVSFFLFFSFKTQSLLFF